MTDSQLVEALRDLLEELEAIGQSHEELYDTEVREQMAEAIRQGFLQPVPGYDLPKSFGTYTAEADLAIRAAVARYIERATRRSAQLGMIEPRARLDAFQDDEAKTRGEGSYYDYFFGWRESI